MFNDTSADALWVVFGVPQDAANLSDLSPDLRAQMYPDGPKALPPELAD